MFNSPFLAPNSKSKNVRQQEIETILSISWKPDIFATKSSALFCSPLNGASFESRCEIFCSEMRKCHYFQFFWIFLLHFRCTNITNMSNKYFYWFRNKIIFRLSTKRQKIRWEMAELFLKNRKITKNLTNNMATN